MAFPIEPPPEARSGVAVSTAQARLLSRLERHCSYAVLWGCGSGSDLGRALDKLGSAELSLDGLRQQAKIMEEVYEASAGVPSADRTQSYPQPTPSASPAGGAAPPQGGPRCLDTSRVKWNYGPTFDARPYLRDPWTAAVFEDPSLNRTAESDWEPARAVKVHADRKELLALFPQVGCGGGASAARH